MASPVDAWRAEIEKEYAGARAELRQRRARIRALQEKIYDWRLGTYGGRHVYDVTGCRPGRAPDYFGTFTTLERARAVGDAIHVEWLPGYVVRAKRRRFEDWDAYRLDISFGDENGIEPCMRRPRIARELSTLSDTSDSEE